MAMTPCGREHFLAATAAHVRHRWCRDYPPVLEVESGDTVTFDCRDSSDGQIRRDSVVSDLMAMDAGRVHAITGPVAVKGAMPGDVLEIRVREIGDDGWGWTGITPGLGFLADRFAAAHLVMWEFARGFSASLPPARVPIAPFPGILGVAPAEPGEHRTRPPGAFGGNMDVRECRVGATIFLPVFCAGALLSIGDVHGAQGDGEVCLRGIEMPARVTVELHLHRGRSLSAPLVDAPPRPPDDAGAWLMVEAGSDVLGAARRATSRAVDLLADGWGIAPVDAYVLCSAAMDLKLSQVVNGGVVTVTAALPKALLPPRTGGF